MSGSINPVVNMPPTYELRLERNQDWGDGVHLIVRDRDGDDQALLSITDQGTVRLQYISSNYVPTYLKGFQLSKAGFIKVVRD